MARYVALVCLPLVLALAPSASHGGNSESILFWSDEPFPSLLAMRPDGSGRHRLFRTPQNAKRPTLSPDGKWIAFDGAPPGKPPLSDFDIQIVRIDGTHRRTLVRSPLVDLDPQWSPNGVRLSFSRWPPTADFRRSSIWIVDREGSGLQTLGQGQFARWSPDGKLLALDVPTKDFGADLIVLDLSSGDRRRVLATPQLEQPADWSPDGSRILFTRFYLAGGSDVFVVNVDGTGLRRLTRAPGEDFAAAWSPDGSRIVFTSQRMGHPQVYVMNADGSQQRNISRTRSNDFATGWH